MPRICWPCSQLSVSDIWLTSLTNMRLRHCAFPHVLIWNAAHTDDGRLSNQACLQETLKCSKALSRDFFYREACIEVFILLLNIYSASSLLVYFFNIMTSPFIDIFFSFFLTDFSLKISDFDLPSCPRNFPISAYLNNMIYLSNFLIIKRIKIPNVILHQAFLLHRKKVVYSKIGSQHAEESGSFTRKDGFNIT